LENNLGANPSKGHVHSNYARLIVNDLVVGVYEKSIETHITECYPDHKMTEMWNTTTGTVYLRAFESVKIGNFRSFFPGLEMIGKHFKVKSCNTVSVDAVTGKLRWELYETGRDVNRHYTICNVMRRSFYEPLLDCLTTGNSRELIDEVFKG
jgi:hypothetical protein